MTSSASAASPSLPRIPPSTSTTPSHGRAIKINIVDTPGHADFGGEVERVMNMVDGVLLLVDAAEGPMPQTRFVLKKALQMGHKAIVVINKVDRKDAEPARVSTKPLTYSSNSARPKNRRISPSSTPSPLTQRAGLTPDLGPDLQPLFDVILKHIPAPKVDADAPLQLLVTTLGYDDYRGVTAVGTRLCGQDQSGTKTGASQPDGKNLPESAKYLYTFQGLNKVEIDEVSAGDIVSLAGLEGIAIGETLADPAQPRRVAYHQSGGTHRPHDVWREHLSVHRKEGKWSTSRKLRERLFDELRTNVALRVEETDSAENFFVRDAANCILAS
jgi:GTP-binding protein